MIRIAPYLATGFAALLALDHVPSVAQYLSTTPASASGMASTAAVKGDRLAPARVTSQATSVMDLNNVTVVFRGSIHSDVSVSQRPRNPTRDAKPPVEETRDLPRPARAKMPVGCESSFSPVASPEMAHHMGRCMS